MILQEWGVNLLVILFTAWALVESLAWQLDAALFPRLIGIPLLLLCLWQLAAGGRSGRGRAERAESGAGRVSEASPGGGSEKVPAADGPDPADRPEERRNLFSLVAWLLLLVLGLWVFGFPLGIPIFLSAYLRFRSREPWWLALSAGCLSWLLVVYGLGGFMQVSYPLSLLQVWLAG